MSQYNDPFHRVVANMMAKYGTDAQLIIQEVGEYDPETQESPVTETTYTVRAAFFDLTLQSNGLGSQQNTLIQEGDQQVLIQPLNKTNPALIMPKIEPNKTTIKIGDTVYKIVTMKQYNPTRNDAILFDCYVRE